MIAVDTTLEAAHELAAALKYRSKYARTQTMAGEYLAAAALLAAAQPLPEPAELEALRAELDALRAQYDEFMLLVLGEYVGVETRQQQGRRLEMIDAWLAANPEQERAVDRRKARR